VRERSAQAQLQYSNQNAHIVPLMQSNDPGVHSPLDAEIGAFLHLIHSVLLPEVQLESLNPEDPIVVHFTPCPWQLLGTGNYAAVFCHPEHPDFVVKVYAPGREGFEEEVRVYALLEQHPAFSKCFYAEQGFLILLRLYGTTMYDCLHLGKAIPKQVITDIDRALEYARSKGLRPHDIHGHNVMVKNDRGAIVDVSDFLKQEDCSTWDDLKTAYYWIYCPFLLHLPWGVPRWCLTAVRKGYRYYKKIL
jgi:hypothetical protein